MEFQILKCRHGCREDFRVMTDLYNHYFACHPLPLPARLQEALAPTSPPTVNGTRTASPAPAREETGGYY